MTHPDGDLKRWQRQLDHNAVMTEASRSLANCRVLLELTACSLLKSPATFQADAERCRETVRSWLTEAARQEALRSPQ